MQLKKTNTKIKYLRKLARRQFRQKEKKFIIEGTRFVEELLKENWQTEALFYTSKLTENDRGTQLLKLAKQRNVPCWLVADDAMAELADTETPQGVLALVSMPNYPLESLLISHRQPLLVLVDGVQDPGNLGTIVRTADAMAATGVVLLKGTVDLYNAKTLRSTMGSIFHLPIVTGAKVAQLVELLTLNNITLIVGEPRQGTAVQDLDLTQPMALVVGSEAHGPSKQLLSLADFKVTIPMPGRTESLNVGVACSIMLYEAARQRGCAETHN